MSVAQRIRTKLTAGLNPLRLVIHDESHRHAGHTGARPAGETHFRVEIVASAFDGESRIARQRRVYQLLAEELAGPIHALSLTTLTPSEAASG
jgi:BolA protein